MSVPISVSDTTGVFETATSDRGTLSVSCHGTLKAGSSKQGKARRAESASNCVIAYQAPSFCSAKMPRVESRTCGASKTSVRRCCPAGSAGSNAMPMNWSVAGRIVTAVAAALTEARDTLTSSAFSHRTGCGRCSSTSIVISPCAFASLGTTVSVNS